MASDDRRKLAVELFNHVWTLMEMPDRSPEQDDEMIHAAHASRHHWAEVGTGVNLGRDEIEDWDLPYAYEALSRAHLVAGNQEEAERFAGRARELAAQVQDEHDREHLDEDLATLP